MSCHSYVQLLCVVLLGNKWQMTSKIPPNHNFLKNRPVCGSTCFKSPLHTPFICRTRWSQSWAGPGLLFAASTFCDRWGMEKNNPRGRGIKELSFAKGSLRSGAGGIFMPCDFLGVLKPNPVTRSRHEAIFLFLWPMFEKKKKKGVFDFWKTPTRLEVYWLAFMGWLDQGRAEWCWLISPQDGTPTSSCLVLLLVLRRNFVIIAEQRQTYLRFWNLWSWPHVPPATVPPCFRQECYLL